MDEVKERALECIADESYLERWKDQAERIQEAFKSGDPVEITVSN